MGVNLDGGIATSNSMLANVEALAQSESSLHSEYYDKYSACAKHFILHWNVLDLAMPVSVHILRAYHPQKKTVCKN